MLESCAIKHSIRKIYGIWRQNSGKFVFWAKIGQKTVFRSHFGRNLGFVIKIARIRKSHYQPKWCAKFQRNLNFRPKKSPKFKKKSNFFFLPQIISKSSKTHKKHCLRKKSTGRVLWDLKL